MSAPPALTPSQAQAADPALNAWVSASAGTGKTQVLTGRVLRLLLAGAAPEAILCLTFTRAAAAEMTRRLYATLGRWARADDAALAAELAGLGAPPEQMPRARTLFATCIDAAGGLRVDTLHAFAQSLLSAFPLEADVPPGFHTLDDEDSAQALKEVASAAIARAERDGDRQLLEDLERVATGVDSFAKLLVKLSKHTGVVLEALPDAATIEPAVRHLLGLPQDGTPGDWLANALARGDHAPALLARIRAAWDAGTKAEKQKAAQLADWLASPDPAGDIDTVMALFFKEDDEPRALKPTENSKAAEPDLAALCAQAQAALQAMRETLTLFEAAETGAAHLRLIHALGGGFERRRRQTGAMRYDDLIERAARLFQMPGAGDWVRYKLDQRIEHVLVDEAQDTNDAQWRIVGALVEEYFAGAGAHEGPRSLFAVGDVKQAIFGFQGTDPATFLAAEAAFGARALAANVPFTSLPLATSFRSTPAVLQVVDQVLTDLGPAALGQDAASPVHKPARLRSGGRVVLWPMVEAAQTEEADWTPDQDLMWEPDAELQLASRIAEQIKAWLEARTLLPARGRPIRPGDILLLVRSRTTIAAALIAALNAAGIPVAGHDRVKLLQETAIRDVMALLRFVLQPADDLSLAELLKSPFLGWSEDRLMCLAHARPGSLWTALQTSQDTEAAQAAAWLGQALAAADMTAPYEFLAHVLGPLQGAERLYQRLGLEAQPALALLLDLALKFEADNSPALQGFLGELEASERDIKRDPDAPRDEVRLMTAHGAKGLQAPIVILADASRPFKAQVDHVLLKGQLPLWAGGKSRFVGPLAQPYAVEAEKQRQEHWRLLYVALTRAEDWLFVAGWKPRKADGADPWYGVVRAALEGLGAATMADPLWGDVLVHETAQAAALPTPPPLEVAAAAEATLPGWVRRAPAPEPAPPRPLAPSRDYTSVSPASSPGGDPRAARRGSLLHTLFEHLPAVPPAERAARATAWLARQAADFSAQEREAMAAEALTVLETPGLEALFGPEAFAEAPVAAILGDRVVQGRIDRLLIAADHVQFIDFKTSLRIPPELPPAIAAQMDAYARALALAFPKRRIQPLLLWTAGPRLMRLPVLEQAQQ